MNIDTDLSPETVEWTDNDQRALDILIAKKQLVQRIQRDNLLGTVKSWPVEMSDGDLVGQMIDDADKLIEFLTPYKKAD